MNIVSTFFNSLLFAGTLASAIILIVAFPSYKSKLTNKSTTNSQISSNSINFIIKNDIKQLNNISFSGLPIDLNIDIPGHNLQTKLINGSAALVLKLFNWFTSTNNKKGD